MVRLHLHEFMATLELKCLSCIIGYSIWRQNEAKQQQSSSWSCIKCILYGRIIYKAILSSLMKLQLLTDLNIKASFVTVKDIATYTACIFFWIPKRQSRNPTIYNIIRWLLVRWDEWLNNWCSLHYSFITFYRLRALRTLYSYEFWKEKRDKLKQFSQRILQVKALMDSFANNWAVYCRDGGRGLLRPKKQMARICGLNFRLTLAPNKPAMLALRPLSKWLSQRKTDYFTIAMIHHDKMILTVA